MNRFDVQGFARRVATLALAAALGLAAAAGPSAAEEVERTVLFRDGTVLRLKLPGDAQLPWRRITLEGEVIESPVSLDQVAQLTLVVTPATEQVAEIRRMIAALADDEYENRVQAQRALVERGAKFRKILELSTKITKDFEARWRLDEVIRSLPEDEASMRAEYDLLKTSEGGPEIDGDVGQWSLETDYRGKTVRLDRRNVRALRAAPLEFSRTAEPPVAIVHRIPEDRDELFPKDVVRIDFDHGPQGETLQVQEDVRRTYVAQGCTFTATVDAEDVKDPYVAVEAFNVGGRSGGHCAATHEPIYQGVITIRFCLPGNERAPAGVRYVGLWASHVTPDGTSLEAFDVRGRRIAEIKTTREVRDFLALESNTPIASVKIVPHPEIDPDCAIDDLVFDTPRPLAEAGDAEHFSVLLTTGERLHCRSLKPGMTVALEGLSIGIDRLEIPLDQVAIVVPPSKASSVPASVPDYGFVRLSDGSILRCHGGERLAPWRLDGLQIQPQDLVAIWGAKTSLVDPEDGDWPEHGALLIDAKGEPLAIEGVKLGPKWVEAAALSDFVSELTYENSPLIWFARPRVRPEGTGLLRLVSGEELVLAGPKSDKTGFSLVTWSADGVEIARGDQQWSIGLGEISSLLLPGR